MISWNCALVGAPNPHGTSKEVRRCPRCRPRPPWELLGRTGHEVMFDLRLSGLFHHCQKPQLLRWKSPQENKNRIGPMSLAASCKPWFNVSSLVALREPVRICKGRRLKRPGQDQDAQPSTVPPPEGVANAWATTEAFVMSPEAPKQSGGITASRTYSYYVINPTEPAEALCPRRDT